MPRNIFRASAKANSNKGETINKEAWGNEELKMQFFTKPIKERAFLEAQEL